MNNREIRPAGGSALLLTLLLLAALALLILSAQQLTQSRLLASANLGSSVAALAENENTQRAAIAMIRNNLRRPQSFDWQRATGLYDRRRTPPLAHSRLTDRRFWNDANTRRAGKHSRYLVEYLGRVVFQDPRKRRRRPVPQAVDLFLLTSFTSRPDGASCISQLLYSQKADAAAARHRFSGDKVQRLWIPTGVLNWTDL